jgi:hypothetical protein
VASPFLQPGVMASAPTQAAIHHAPASAGGTRVWIALMVVVGVLIFAAAILRELLVARRPRQTSLGAEAGAEAEAGTVVASVAPAPSASTGAQMPAPASASASSHGGGHVAPPPPMPAEEDAGSLSSPPTYGSTGVSVEGGTAYRFDHVYFVMAPLMQRMDQCAQKTPLADFRPGTVIRTLSDSFVVTVDAQGNALAVGHKTSFFSAAFDACVRPILLSTRWGRPTKPGTFVVSLHSERKAS